MVMFYFFSMIKTHNGLQSKRVAAFLSWSPSIRDKVQFDNLGGSKLMMNSAELNIVATPIDKSIFDKQIEVLAIQVPKKDTSSVVRLLNPYLLDFSRHKRVVDDPKSPQLYNLVRFKPEVVSLDELSQSSRQSLNEMKYNISSSLVELSYTDFTAAAALGVLLPPGVQTPSSFETAGHIAHLNLQDEQLPFKHLIGQVILDKNPKTLRTVVNKVGRIDSRFRTFAMEVVAGACAPGDFEAEVREQGARLRFDFRKVYWNSRLQTEHTRLVSLFKEGQVICDMFCGIGPFSIPAAMKGCHVLANDLNPESYNFLLQNIKINKMDQNIEAFNMDAKEFVSMLSNKTLSCGKGVDHFVMNLPDSSIEFYDAFNSYAQGTAQAFWVHCYCFSSTADPVADALQRVQAKLSPELLGRIKQTDVHHVRGVSPTKVMLCVSINYQ